MATSTTSSITKARPFYDFQVICPPIAPETAPPALRLTPHCSTHAAGRPRLAGVEWLHMPLFGRTLTAEAPAMRSTMTFTPWLRVPGGFVCRKVSPCVAVSLRLCELCACLSARGRLVSCASVPAVSVCRLLRLSLRENDDWFGKWVRPNARSNGRPTSWSVLDVLP